ncbi:MAG TPA: thermonuclease family protein [Micavibrio sp.]
MKIIVLSFFIALIIPFAAFAADEPPILPSLDTAADARPLQQTQSERMAQVIDDHHILLKNGRVVELTGIEIPQSTGFGASEQAAAAGAFIKSLFEKDADSDVMLYQTPGAGKGRTNRLGHDLAHVVRKNGHIWIQGALLANGLARARPTPDNPELAIRMMALEDQARMAGKGLWAKDSQYRLIQATDPIEITDQFAVVEGVVKNVSTINNVTYLNFGDDWRKDFTTGIPSAIRQAMSRNNLDVFRLQNQRVRVHGWLRAYNGPYIELEMPVLLEEVSKTAAPATASETPPSSVMTEPSANQ